MGKNNEYTDAVGGSTGWEEEVVAEFIRNGGHRVNAIISKHPKSSRWTKASIASFSSKFFYQPKIIRMVKEFKKEIMFKLAVSEADILQEAACIAHSDLIDMFDEDGDMLKPYLWPKNFRAAVASLELGERGDVVKFKLWDKSAAQEKLFKHLGLYEKDNNQRNPLAADIENIHPDVRDKIMEKLRQTLDTSPASKPKSRINTTH